MRYIIVILLCLVSLTASAQTNLICSVPGLKAIIYDNAKFERRDQFYVIQNKKVTYTIPIQYCILETY